MKKTNLSDFDNKTVPNGKGYRIGVVAAEWNPEVTDAMCKGAVDTLREHGVLKKDITVLRVPGTFELTYAAARYAHGRLLIDGEREADAVICLGCVSQGETRHFDFICEGVANGLSAINADGEIPVIFGVLTTDNIEQAIERAGTKAGNKGADAAKSAIEMTNLLIKYANDNDIVLEINEKNENGWYPLLYSISNNSMYKYKYIII